MRPACANPVVSLSNHGLQCGPFCSEDNLYSRHPACHPPRTRRPSPAAGRRCDGYAGASSATRGPVPPGPRRPGQASLRAPCGAPRDLEGSRGLPCGTRVGDFCPGAQLWLPALARHRTLSRKGGRRLRAIADALPETVATGPPGSRAIRRLYLPGAGRCHVKDGCASTSRRRQRHAQDATAAEERG